MADLIERDAVLSDINEEIEANQEYPEDKLIRKGLRIARKCIENALSVNRWIPCSERLPDNGVAVLVYTGENNFKVWLAEYSKYMEVWTLAGNYVPIKKNAVSHWMPLPSTEGLT